MNSYQILRIGLQIVPTIYTELYYDIEWRWIMVIEGVKFAYGLSVKFVIFVLSLGAEVVNFVVVGVFSLEESLHFFDGVAVPALGSFRRVSHRYNLFSNVTQIKVKTVLHEPPFLLRDHPLDDVQSTMPVTPDSNTTIDLLNLCFHSILLILLIVRLDPVLNVTGVVFLHELVYN